MFAIQQDSAIELRSATTLEKVGQIGLRRAAVFIAFSPNGRFLACGFSDSDTLIVDVRTGSVLANIEMVASHLEWSMDSNLVFVMNSQLSMAVFSAATGHRVASLESLHSSSTMLGFATSPDNKRLISSSGDGKLIVWEMGTWRHLGTVEVGGGWSVAGKGFHPQDKHILVAGSNSGELVVFNVEAPSLERKHPAHSNYCWIRHIKFSADGTRLLSGVSFGSGKRGHALMHAWPSCAVIFQVGDVDADISGVLWPRIDLIVAVSNKSVAELLCYDAETGQKRTNLNLPSTSMTYADCPSLPWDQLTSLRDFCVLRAVSLLPSLPLSRVPQHIADELRGVATRVHQR
eukprot:TRINITY_DN10785_c0_g1_i1.p1 TRINITY_DN10785_c0_g1~~TRINITY_DN10785_c0_g1_i1.p1  ORF type:complete len:346 (+),score=57.15 TRINITY_DN10785_c0_g1_i1:2-1039(+)